MALGILLGFLPASGATIGDKVWFDRNGNGLLDANESGVSNVQLILDCPGSQSCATATTNSSGTYSFNGLAVGTYTVRVNTAGLNPNYQPSFDFDGVLTPHRATVTVTAAQTQNGVDFGYLTIFCLDGTPAFPVPEFRDGVRLWADDFQPVNPGVQIPSNRDSTNYTGFQLPGAGSGTEFFSELDILGNYLYMVYNSGFQIWDISGGLATNPNRVSIRDGWLHQFLNFPTLPTELYLVLWGIDVIDPPGGGADEFVVVAGVSPGGLSIWDVSDKANPRALYQDMGRAGRQVRTAHVNGRTYAFFSTFGPQAGGQAGLYVYDLTRAKANYQQAGFGCLEDTTIATTCPGVLRGRIGNWAKAEYVDIIERAGTQYLVFSDADLASTLGVEIHELVDPANPSSGTILRGAGLNRVTKGLALFEKGGQYYLGAKEGLNHAIYNVTNCLDSNGCGSLGSPVWSRSVGNQGELEYMNFSRSGTVPFLHAGLHRNFCSNGVKREWLYDLTNLGGSNNITEITDSGGLVEDPYHGANVDYWGSYYDGNVGGYSSVVPHMGKFKDQYFYRAAWSLFDIHEYGASTTAPQITTTVMPGAGQPPYWMGDEVDFRATPNSGCQPSAGGWSWDAVTGGNVSWQLFDSDNAGNATLKFFCDDANNNCPDRQVTVTGENAACASATLAPSTITVEDPRPAASALALNPPGGTYPVCTQLQLTSLIDGRRPLSYTWRIDGEVEATGTVTSNTTTSLTLNWDTSDVDIAPVPEIFLDGFESGDTTNWSAVVGRADNDRGDFGKAESYVRGGAKTLAEKGGMSATFTVELQLSNASGLVTQSTPVTLTPLGVLGFSTPPISATDHGDGDFSFHANTENATEWRWEIEQTTAAGGPAPPVVFDWGEAGADLDFTWIAPNVAGRDYTVTVQARNCNEGPLTRSIEVFVSEIGANDPPVINTFVIDPAELDCLPPSFGFCECTAGSTITFDTTSVSSPTSYEFDWNNDGTPDQSSAGGASGTAGHAFTVGEYSPKARAVKGSLVSNWLGLALCPQGLHIE